MSILFTSHSDVTFVQIAREINFPKNASATLELYGSNEKRGSPSSEIKRVRAQPIWRGTVQKNSRSRGRW